MGLGLLVAALLATDGGGNYTLYSDYEWPGAPTSMLLINNDTYNSVMTDGGQAIGSQTLFNYDGGVIVDSKGLYFVRGPTNVWANVHTWAFGFPDTSNGGRYEVCFTPSFSSSQWSDGVNPNWDGTIYLMDVNMVTQHTVAFIFGAYAANNLYVRLNGSGETTLQLPVSWKADHQYCVSAEWAPADSDGGFLCNAWVRYNSCALTPVPYCTASTIIGAIEDGTSACPSPSPTYVTLAQRQYGWDTTDMAPTTVHVSAVRAWAK